MDGDCLRHRQHGRHHRHGVRHRADRDVTRALRDARPLDRSGGIETIGAGPDPSLDLTVAPRRDPAGRGRIVGVEARADDLDVHDSAQRRVEVAGEAHDELGAPLVEGTGGQRGKSVREVADERHRCVGEPGAA